MAGPGRRGRFFTPFFFTSLSMSTISKALQGLLFDGAALALATAPGKDKARAVCGG